jgi:hypothetical protein
MCDFAVIGRKKNIFQLILRGHFHTCVQQHHGSTIVRKHLITFLERFTERSAVEESTRQTKTTGGTLVKRSHGVISAAFTESIFDAEDTATSDTIATSVPVASI